MTSAEVPIPKENRIPYLENNAFIYGEPLPCPIVSCTPSRLDQSIPLGSQTNITKTPIDSPFRYTPYIAKTPQGSIGNERQFQIQEHYPSNVMNLKSKPSKNARKHRITKNLTLPKKNKYSGYAFSKYNSRSPYANSTFSQEMKSMENQRFTYNKENQRMIHNKSKSPLRHKRRASVKGRKFQEEFIKKLVRIVLSHSKHCSQLKSKFEKLRKEYC